MMTWPPAEGKFLAPGGRGATGPTPASRFPPPGTAPDEGVVATRRRTPAFRPNALEMVTSRGKRGGGVREVQGGCREAVGRL